MTPLLAFMIPPVLFAGGLLALLYALRGRADAAPPPAPDAGDWFDQLRGAEAEPAPAPDAAPAEAEGPEATQAESPFLWGYDDGLQAARAAAATGRFEETEGWEGEPEDDAERRYRDGFETAWNGEARRRAAAPPARPQPAPYPFHAPAPAFSFLGHPVRQERRLNPLILERQTERDAVLRAVFAGGPLTRAEAKDALRARGVGERRIKGWLESTSGRFTLPDAAGRFTLAPA